MAKNKNPEKNRPLDVTRDKEENEGDPICEKCGNAMLEENGELLCPHCHGEIDFLGGEDEGLV